MRLPFTTLCCEDDSQSGSCLLYAMLIEHVDPTPVAGDTEEQLTKSMSRVPSRSMTVA